MKEYNPHPRTAQILDYAMEKIKSVPYRPNSRWVFYRVYQKFGLKKEDVKLFDNWTSKARKRFYKEWRPDILADSIRKPSFRGQGFKSVEQWLGYTIATIKNQTCILEKISKQKYYIQLWFEAEAMHEQFKYFTNGYHVSLVPFRGDVSIAIKWEIAKRLERIYKNYQKPIVILYFGDLDTKGEEIPENALKDIKNWCGINFKTYWCGLTKKQIRKYKLPENPEKPGQYQWEALEHDQAGELILNVLDKFLDKKIIDKIVEQEREAEEEFKERLGKLMK